MTGTPTTTTLPREASAARKMARKMTITREVRLRAREAAFDAAVELIASLYEDDPESLASDAEFYATLNALEALADRLGNDEFRGLLSDLESHRNGSLSDAVNAIGRQIIGKLGYGVLDELIPPQHAKAGAE